MNRGACVLSLLLLGQGVSAQEILWQKVGIAGQTYVGGRPVFLGDLDGDGWVDVLTTEQFFVSPASPFRLTVLSGRDGQTLRTFPNPSPNPLLPPIPTAAGDYDGDGVRDYSLGLTDAFTFSLVRVYSGRDNSVLWQVSGAVGLGANAIGDLDVDGDGRPDVVMQGPTGTDTMLAYSNSSATPLYSVSIKPWGLPGRVGDINGDGCDEFVVGSPTPPFCGGAYVFSGKDGRLLVSGTYAGCAQLGTAISFGVGDVDGDGIPDFASSNDTTVSPGVAIVFSGATGNPIYVWNSGVPNIFGRWMDTADLDLDGVADLLVGSGQTVQNTGGRIHWFSLRDGSEVTQLWPPGLPSYTTFFGDGFEVGPAQPGSSFSVMMEWDRWGLIGTQPFPAQGRWTMYRMAPPGVADLGPGCAGTLGAAPQFGLRQLGGRAASALRVHVSGAPPGVPAALLLGFSSTAWAGVSLPLSLAGFGFGGCELRTSVEVAAPWVTGTSGVNAGYAFADLLLPLAVPPAGFAVHGQVLTLGRGGSGPGAVSNALRWWHR